MDDTTIWRIHLKTQGAAFKIGNEHNLRKLFEFCIRDGLQHGIIGVGWSNFGKRPNTGMNPYLEIDRVFYNNLGAKRALNAMCQMKVGDLAWTRTSAQVYYLCRITKPWLETEAFPEHFDFDIANFAEAEWVEIGTEDKVPGKVVASFRASAAAQRVHDVTEISKYIWNNKTDGIKYPQEKVNCSLWNYLSAETIEELVLLYLQVQMKYKIFTATHKKDTPLYECVMVHPDDGSLAYPQVKSGNEVISLNEYLDILKHDPKATIYLFDSSLEHKRTKDDRFRYISKTDMQRFIDEYRDLLPQRTRDQLDLIENT